MKRLILILMLVAAPVLAVQPDEVLEDPALEDRARQVLDRIAFALAGADRATLNPANGAPGFQNQIEYTISLGVDEEGAPVWGAPEVIGVSGNGDQVFWAENPGAEEERRVVWCNAVREFFEGEFPNGFDDNENGLNDEGGLNFVVDGNSVEIGLTLERELTGEGPITKTVETLITCRN